MAFYEVFGGVLQSDIDFPELKVISGERPQWTLRRTSSLSPLVDPEIVGEEALAGGVAARLERSRDRFRLCFDDTGTFDVARDGTSIHWSPVPDASPAIVRADVLGRVLSVALHASGDLCLHASAVAVGEYAIAFVGARGYGKSTLTMALLAQGARLVADDTVRLTGTPPRVAVAVPTIRLRNDTAARFGIAGSPAEVGDKVILRDAPLPDERWLPLGAVYLLAPRTAQRDTLAVTRRQLGSLEATLALVGHGKIAPLLGKDEAARVLRRASVVARDVPVFVLEVGRDLDRLDEVATTIAGWHSESS
jgi:hypothetical protein